MKDASLNLKQEPSEIHEDEFIIVQYLQEHFPYLAANRLLIFEKFLKVLLLFCLGSLMIFERNECTPLDTVQYAHSCDNLWWIKIIGGILSICLGCLFLMSKLLGYIYATRPGWWDRKTHRRLFAGFLLLTQGLCIESSG